MIVFFLVYFGKFDSLNVNLDEGFQNPHIFFALCVHFKIVVSRISFLVLNKHLLLLFLRFFEEDLFSYLH